MTYDVITLVSIYDFYKSVVKVGGPALASSNGASLQARSPLAGQAIATFNRKSHDDAENLRVYKLSSWRCGIRRDR